MPESRWQTGAEVTARGLVEVVNMPTEEVFTTPHRLRTEGVVRSTLPLAVNGQVVRDLTLRFEAGRVVDVSATSGADVVREEMASDEGASFLGEVAIVDGDSRVGKTGLDLLRHAVRRERVVPHRLRPGHPDGGRGPRRV